MSATISAPSVAAHNDPAVPMSHAWFVKNRGENPCDCDVREAAWPYDCDAKRKNPNATVYICHTHRCWWHD